MIQGMKLNKESKCLVFSRIKIHLTIKQQKTIIIKPSVNIKITQEIPEIIKIISILFKINITG